MVRRKGVAALGMLTLALERDAPADARERRETIPLPAVSAGAARLDDVLRDRRSVRTFSDKPISEGQLGQLCWAAQGITEPTHGLRTTPSAGALYPLELYVVRSNGLFRYDPRGHLLRRVDDGDRRESLARAALGQDAVRHAAADLVITAVVSRTSVKYGSRAERYVHLEAGHAAQNVLLEATALGLAGVPVGAFDDSAVRGAIGAGKDEAPVYILAIGRPPA